MLVEGFGCLLVNNARSRAYLQKLIALSYEPEKVILVEFVRKACERGGMQESPSLCGRAIMTAFGNRKYFLYENSPNAISPVGNRTAEKYASFDPQKPLIETLREAKLDYETIMCDSLNDPVVIEAVAKASPTFFLFSGGGTLRKEILSLGKKFIHLHPGYLPDVRGSMAIEWSILAGGKCAVSALFMAEKIDEGEIIAQRWFEPPGLEHGNIPKLYSSHIRSELLLDVMRSYIETGSLTGIPQEPIAGNTYYKMHPVLNNIVFFECLKRK